jgi:hypothetical protein
LPRDLFDSPSKKNADQFEVARIPRRTCIGFRETVIQNSLSVPSATPSRPEKIRYRGRLAKIG